jgi:hypothetical protein
MTNEQEKRRVAEILAKQERGEKLTDKEWTILAYSPYGTGGGCASCAPGVERPQQVKLPACQEMFDFGKDVELIAAMFLATR